ncbi:unnamed protein product [Rotaria sordida]|uniref:Uncharacterized protein n=1 Tax=Rotaria sordida TaxID=392033 RepID=A0A814K2P7_9BILA|nr:unnamed protein product [Rotaria sordida]
MRIVVLGNESLQLRKLDKHLIKMLLVQVTLLLLFTFSHAIQRLYLTFAPNPSPQSLQDPVQNLIFNLFTLFSFVASEMPIYIYTLSGSTAFRNTCLRVVKTVVSKIRCH